MGLFSIKAYRENTLELHFLNKISVPLCKRMSLCSTSPVLSYLPSSLGTAWLSKDALLLEQSLALSKGQEHKSGPCPWKRVEWPWTRALRKAKCSHWFFDLGFVQQHLFKDVNLQPLLALSFVETEQSSCWLYGKNGNEIGFILFNFWKTSAYGCLINSFCVALADYAQHNPEI